MLVVVCNLSKRLFSDVCVSSCWRRSVQDLFEVDGTSFFCRVTWDQATNVGMYTMQHARVAIIFWCLLPLNPIRRKFRSQTSDNMERCKSRGGKSQGGEEEK